MLHVARTPTPPCVATVGRLELEPGAANVVPARVTLTVDARAPSSAELGALVEAIGFAPSLRVEPVAMSGPPLEALRAAAAGAPEAALSAPEHDAGIPRRRRRSLRDAVRAQRLNGGASHSPAERSSEGDVALALETTLVRALDRIAR